MVVDYIHTMALLGKKNNQLEMLINLGWLALSQEIK